MLLSPPKDPCRKAACAWKSRPSDTEGEDTECREVSHRHRTAGGRRLGDPARIARKERAMLLCYVCMCAKKCAAVVYHC